MAKKSKKNESKAAQKAQKKAKSASKSDAKASKHIKKSKKDKTDDIDEVDLIQTLEEYRVKWEEEHRMVEDIVDGPPSKRANCTLTACPAKDNLYLFGGEYYDGQTVAVYNDLYRFSPEKNEWRRLTSPTCPGPRSAHQTVSSPAAGGRLFLFGGEFSSPNQNSFHHYRDMWMFDITTNTWSKIDGKGPSARSGHRMVTWKNYIFLFGGFQDTGIRTSYLGDLWYFDMTTFKWKEIEIPVHFQRPGPRSGFSLLPTPEGILLHGGYVKTYESKRSIGVGQSLSDSWFLKLHLLESGELDLKTIKWEKKKKLGYSPSPRSGCTMAWWANKSMGVLFGGVFDDEKDEETLESVFYNELFGFNLTNTKWVSLALKKKKKLGGKKRKAKQVKQQFVQEREKSEVYSDHSDEELAEEPQDIPQEVEEESDPDDPEKSIPSARYNTMMAVQRNTLYIYGGILEAGNVEHTLDDFYTLQLDKLDRFNCLKESVVAEWNGSDSENDTDDSEDESDEDEEDENDEDGIEPTPEDEPEQIDVEQLTEVELAALNAKRIQAEKEQLRARANNFINAQQTADQMLSTPQVGESLAKFFARSKEYWTNQAFAADESSRGKELRRDGFQLAEEAYENYRPILEEIKRIQEEAGVEEAKARASIAESRNRR